MKFLLDFEIEVFLICVNEDEEMGFSSIKNEKWGFLICANEDEEIGVGFLKLGFLNMCE